MNGVLPLVARSLVASVFLASAILKIMDFENVRDVMIAHYLPVSDGVATVLLVGSTVFEAAGAVMLIAGFHTRMAVAMLIVALAPATFVFHVGMSDERETVHFLKNLSILGGLLAVAALGPGPLSFDANRENYDGGSP